MCAYLLNRSFTIGSIDLPHYFMEIHLPHLRIIVNWKFDIQLKLREWTICLIWSKKLDGWVFRSTSIVQLIIGLASCTACWFRTEEPIAHDCVHIVITAFTFAPRNQYLVEGKAQNPCCIMAHKQQTEIYRKNKKLLWKPNI